MRCSIFFSPVMKLTATSTPASVSSTAPTTKKAVRRAFDLDIDGLWLGRACAWEQERANPAGWRPGRFTPRDGRPRAVPRGSMPVAVWVQQEPEAAGLVGAARICAITCCAPAAMSRASELTVTNWKPFAMRSSAASALPL